MKYPRCLAFVLITLLACCADARAGTFQVRACHADGINASWQGTHDGATDAYFECPGGVDTGAGGTTAGMVARNTYDRAARAPGFSNAKVFFDAPPGARIAGIAGEARLESTSGWRAGVRDESAGTWLWCGTNCTSTFGGWYGFSAGGLASGRVSGLVVCGAGGGCPRDRQGGLIALRNVTVTVADDSPPSVSIAKEGLAAPGWHRGVQRLVVNSEDNVGIRGVDAFAGPKGLAARPHRCDDHLAVPCPSEGAVLEPDTALLEDGRHVVTARTIDSAGNVAETTAAALVDNTPPSAVEALMVEGAEGWRSTNELALRWSSPAETQRAPLAASEYLICRAGAANECRAGSRPREIGGIADLALPGPGLWTVDVWLRDAAGNQDRRVARRVTVGYDDAPPVLVQRDARPDDPARLVFDASDTLSGVARGEVELRRRGRSEWQPLQATVADGRLSAVVDDEHLPRATYDVRARVFDNAGNERSAEGTPIAVPLRVDTHLKVGERHGRRLRPRAETVFGRRVRLRGRLTATGGNPLSAREIEVFELVALPGADWRRIGSVRTSRSGRFAYSAARGPSRVIRFRFPGSPTIRARSRDLSIRVRATSTMRSSRRSVVNGESVTFHGRLRGRPIPATGKLLQLQAFSRGRWLTFATPRADSRTGSWRYEYRFAATRGRVRYRFRTRVPREVAFPYAVGTSKTVRVLVRGL
ncbi:MAG TPA: hypothetical protein VF533_07690 [Solirubrobacteraceae bacterium]|jgi:hypothetical protein